MKHDAEVPNEAVLSVPIRYVHQHRLFGCHPGRGHADGLLRSLSGDAGNGDSPFTIEAL